MEPSPGFTSAETGFRPVIVAKRVQPHPPNESPILRGSRHAPAGILAELDSQHPRATILIGKSRQVRE